MQNFIGNIYMLIMGFFIGLRWADKITLKQNLIIYFIGSVIFVIISAVLSYYEN